MKLSKKVRIFKVRKTSKLPIRAHSTDAGMDIFYCPEERLSITIPEKQCVLLPTGVKIEVPAGYMLQIMNKSGLASKRHLITGACVVDEGYTGEIFVNLHNVGSAPQTIEPGQKIAQGVFVKIAKPALEEIGEDKIYDEPTNRGEGSLGSTGEF